MTYEEFLDKYKDEIENLDFGNSIFSEFYGTDLWKKLMVDLIKIGVNPLIGFKEIPDGFFKLCNITKINIPNNIMGIGGAAFTGCKSLTGVEIPDSVTGIGSHAFSFCRSLSEVIIPDSVKIIGWYVFFGCNSLKKITFKGSNDQFKSIEKGSSWKPEGAIEVHCTDGVLIYK